MTPPPFDIATDAIREVAALLKETGLGEIEYAEGDRRIRCVAAVSAPVAAPTPLPVASTAGTSAPAAGPATASNDTEGTPIKSPMVGTVYLAPEPSAKPFVDVGSVVKTGSTLLIIEAMKVMNPIKAPRDGTVIKVVVQDGQPVEFDEPLVILA